MTKSSDDYKEKYMKIKRNSDEELPPNKFIEIPGMIIFFAASFMKIIKIIQKLLNYDRIDDSQTIK